MNKKPKRAPLRLIKDALRHYNLAARDTVDANSAASKAYWTLMLLSYIPGMAEELTELRRLKRTKNVP